MEQLLAHFWPVTSKTFRDLVEPTAYFQQAAWMQPPLESFKLEKSLITGDPCQKMVVGRILVLEMFPGGVSESKALYKQLVGCL